MEWEKKRIEEVTAETFLRNHELEKERKENLRLLNEARAAVRNYRQREEEYPFPLSPFLLVSIWLCFLHSPYANLRDVSVVVYTR